MIELIQLGKSDIITYLEVYFFVIVSYIIYLITQLTFLTNLPNQLILTVTLIAYSILPPQIYICKKVYSYLLKYVQFK